MTIRYALFLIVIVVAAGCTGFDHATTEQREPVTVIEEHSIGQDEAFSRLARWAAQTYRSANHAVQLQDREAGSIVVKGVTPYGGGYIEYTMTMDVREDRVRFIHQVEGVGGREMFTNYVMERDIEHMHSIFDSLRESAMDAVRTADDF